MQDKSEYEYQKKKDHFVGHWLGGLDQCVRHTPLQRDVVVTSSPERSAEDALGMNQSCLRT